MAVDIKQMELAVSDPVPYTDAALPHDKTLQQSHQVAQRIVQRSLPFDIGSRPCKVILANVHNHPSRRQDLVYGDLLATERTC